MPQFSKTLLPPILEYTYPAFRFETDNREGVLVSFSALLSIVNTIDQVDHIQIKIVSLNTNKNALNRNIFPNGTYFISMKNAEDLTIKINTVINNENIFRDTNSEIYPSYYKMQARLGMISDDNYNPSWGQNVSNEWIVKNSENFSEWSNSSVLKTVEKPDFGIFTLNKDIENITTNSNYLWMGYYNTEDGNESLKKYYFQLEDENYKLLEKSEEIYIGEYETPSLTYKFNEIFVHDKIYYLKLYIETMTGYKDFIYYKIKTQFSYVKIYNIFKITENDDDAHNLVDIKARQVTLKSSEKVSNLSWVSDPSMDVFGEYGITHYKNISGQLNGSDEFNIPYNSFSIILSTTNFMEKIQTSLKNCFIGRNYIMKIGHASGYGSNFYLGVYKRKLKYYFVLKEEYMMETRENLYQYYILESPIDIIKNKEFIFIIKKDKGDTIFEAMNWLTNKF